MLRSAADETRQFEPQPKAIVVPHAGYVYSGETAARAYARLARGQGADSGTSAIGRVVLLGPAHRVHVRGLALPEVDAFDTPLGVVRVDQAAVRLIARLRQVVAARPVHAAEHSLEVHLPFLRAVLGDFELVPLVVGEATPAMVAEVLDLLWGGPETLIVISTDLSHYHAYRDAVRIDNATVAAMLDGATSITHEQACGATPVNALMQVARARKLRIELIDQCNSGDTAGPRDRVVGYASFALYESAVPTAVAGVPGATESRASDESSASGDRPESGSVSSSWRHASESVVPQWFPANGGAVLVRLARNAIERALGLPPPPVVADAWLEHAGAVFVTLTQNGALRGCIGSLAPHRSVRADVTENALAAALRDPRFAAVTAQDWPQVRVEVSLLSAPLPLPASDEADALAQLRPLRDGVIFEAGAHRATFLPQVWEQIPEPRAFLAALKQKAGLPPTYWSTEVRLSRYSVAKFTE